MFWVNFGGPAGWSQRDGSVAKLHNIPDKPVMLGIPYAKIAHCSFFLQCS